MTFKSILTAGFTATLIGASSLSGTAALAQDTAPLTAETVTDAHITSFVRAAVLLEDLRRDYTTRIAGAADDEARAALAEEADKTAMELVENVEGITTEQYLILSRLSQENEAINARIAEEVEQLRKKKAEADANPKKQQGNMLSFSNPQGNNTDGNDTDETDTATE